MKRLLSVILAVMLVATSLAGTVFAEYGTFTYDLAADTFVSYSQSNINYGSNIDLILNNKGANTSQDRYALLKVNLIDFLDVEVESATLNFYVYEGKSGGGIDAGDVSLYLIEDNTWEESVVKYPDAPAEEGALAGSVYVDTLNSYYSIDITDVVNADEDKVLSFKMFSADDVRLKINSSNATTNKPYISVTGDKPDVAVSGVELDINSLELTTVDEPVTLTATVSPINATNQTLIWTSSDEDVATVADGVVTPVGEGEATIKVNTQDGGFEAECIVTVSDIHVESVELNEVEASLSVKGRSLQLTATVLPEDATNPAVTWSTSDATIATVTSTGVVAPVSEGEAIITATTVDGGLTAECVVTVLPVGGEGSQEYKVLPTDDTYYGNGTGEEPGPNGELTTLYIRNSQSNTEVVRKGYLRFDLSEYCDYDIASARLYLRQSSATYGGDVEMSIKAFDENGWSEDTASKATPVTPGVLTDLGSVLITVPETEYYIDVLDFVKGENDGIFSIELSLGAVTNYFKLYSSESTIGQPHIELVARPYSLDSSDKAAVKVGTKYTNATEEDYAATLISAEYDAETGEFLGYTADQKPVAHNSSEELNLTFNAQDSSKYYELMTLYTIENPVALKASAKFSGGADKFVPANAKEGVTINGKAITLAGVTTATGTVGLSVIKSGGTVAEDLAYVGTALIDENGKYAFGFNMPASADGGMYTAYLAIPGAPVQPMNLLYAKTASEVIENLDSETTADEFISIIEPNAKVLGLSDNKIYTEFYLNLDEEEKTEIVGKILDEMGTPSTANDIIGAIEEVVVLNHVNGVKTSSPVHEVITKAYAELGLNEKVKASNGKTLSYKEMLGILKDETAPAKELYGDTFTSKNNFASNVKEQILSFYNKENPKSSDSGPSGPSGPSGNLNFSMPNSNLTYDPTNTANPIATAKPSTKLFSDLDGYDWAESYINSLYNKGVVNGKADQLFDPASDVTREEFVKMLVVAFNLNTNGAECSFSDVPAGEWYYEYIATGVKFGIVKGISETEFGTGNSITRQEMAVMAYRALSVGGFSAEPDGTVFGDDAEIADWAKDAVKAMKGAGIINGMGNGNFEPDGLANRAQAAVIVGKLVENYGL